MITGVQYWPVQQICFLGKHLHGRHQTGAAGRLRRRVSRAERLLAWLMHCNGLDAGREALAASGSCASHHMCWGLRSVWLALSALAAPVPPHAGGSSAFFASLEHAAPPAGTSRRIYTTHKRLWARRPCDCLQMVMAGRRVSLAALLVLCGCLVRPVAAHEDYFPGQDLINVCTSEYSPSEVWRRLREHPPARRRLQQPATRCLPCTPIAQLF